MLEMFKPIFLGCTHLYTPNSFASTNGQYFQALQFLLIGMFVIHSENTPMICNTLLTKIYHFLYFRITSLSPYCSIYCD